MRGSLEGSRGDRTYIGSDTVTGSYTTLRDATPFPASMRDELALACAGKGPADFVFESPHGGALRIGNWRRRVFDPACATLGLDGVTPHDLRHTATSLAIAAGGTAKDVQRTLGHASAAMTLDVYAGLFKDHLDAVADRLDALVLSVRPDGVRDCPTNGVSGLFG